MAGTTELKRNRMHLRLDANAKRKLERAAAYAQRTTTEFVLENAVQAAERVIEQHERVVLSPPDWEAFHEALINPPRPNADLRAAVRWYRELTK